MDIYNWDMRIKTVDDFMKDYYTSDKVYEVRDGIIILDKKYASQNKQTSLNEFLKRWSGDWTITRIKVNENWYVLEQ